MALNNYQVVAEDCLKNLSVKDLRSIAFVLDNIPTTIGEKEKKEITTVFQDIFKIFNEIVRELRDS